MSSQANDSVNSMLNIGTPNNDSAAPVAPNESEQTQQPSSNTSISNQQNPYYLHHPYGILNPGIINQAPQQVVNGYFDPVFPIPPTIYQNNTNYYGAAVSLSPLPHLGYPFGAQRVPNQIIFHPIYSNPSYCLSLVNHSAAQGVHNVQANPTHTNGAREQINKGPEGCNVFVFHLPPDMNDQGLEALFSPFGNILSTKVVINLRTGTSKGYGFVSYESPVSAQQAILNMNGYQIREKTLKVELKREKITVLPYL